MINLDLIEKLHYLPLSRPIDWRPLKFAGPMRDVWLQREKTKAITNILTNKAEKPGEHNCTDISEPYKKSIIVYCFWALDIDEYSGKSWSNYNERKCKLAAKVTAFCD